VSRSEDRPCLLVLERGLSIPIPDLRRIPGLLFPVLGDYCLLDFLLASLAPLSPRPVVVLEERTRELAAPATERWGGFGVETVVVEPGLEPLVDMVTALPEEELLLCSTTFAALFDPARLLAELRTPRKERLTKIAVDGTPLDFYAVRKRTLLAVMRRPTTRRPEEEPFVDQLFERSLHDGFNHMAELPGRVVLCRNLTQFYHQNIAMARRPVEWAGWRDVLDRFRVDPKSVYVAATGYVKSSLLGAGAEVAGRVENSALYPGVSIGAGAVIKDSVIMSNIHVGRGATLERALVLPSRDRMRSHPTLEEKVLVGGATGNISNTRFPEQIHDGITVIGPGVELPRGIAVDQGCYLSASYPAASLKRLRKLARGSSYLSERAADEP
jgi:hypothetical protein